MIFTITDEAGRRVRELTTKADKGLKQITWDLEWASTRPLRMKGKTFNPFDKVDGTFPVMPGKYAVTMSKWENGKITPLAGPVSFNIVPLNNRTIPIKDRPALHRFHEKLMDMVRVVQGAERLTDELVEKTQVMKQAVHATPGAYELLSELLRMRLELDKIQLALNGFRSKASSEEIPPSPVPIRSRLRTLLYSQIAGYNDPSPSVLNTYEIIREEIAPLLTQLERIQSKDLKEMYQKLDKAGVPWTPGRVPVLK